MISLRPAAFEGLSRLIACCTSSGVIIGTSSRQSLAVHLLILRSLWHPLGLLLGGTNCLQNMLLSLLDAVWDFP